ncbi:hypothetical protein [Streptomyces sp. NPDC050535]|uniref:hypothetical protein n=1 Tax=Streptomyces sp. NPDC050535 TaxID=3365626 RepID=UPI00379FACB0
MSHRLHPAQLVPAVLLMAAAIGGCSASASPAADQPAPAGRATAAAPLSHALPQDPVPMVLPATGADTRLTVGLGTFGQTVSAAVTARCAHDAGRPRPQGPPPMFVRLGALPDLDLLERDGFNGGPAPDLPSVLRTAADSAEPGAASADDSDAVVLRCAAAGTTAVRALDALSSPLQSEWWNTLDTLRSQPRVRHALAEVPKCLDRRHNLRVDNEDDFFALVDSRLAEHADDTTALVREDHELAGAYADCMRPVEAVREPLRQKLRERFVAENSREIASLRSQLGPAVRELEKRHGVHISFPTL